MRVCARITQYNKNALVAFVGNIWSTSEATLFPSLHCCVKNKRGKLVRSLVLTAHPPFYLAMHKRTQPDVDIMWHNFPLTTPVWPLITRTADASNGWSARSSCDPTVFPVWNLILMERCILHRASCSRMQQEASHFFSWLTKHDWFQILKLWTVAKRLSQRCRICWDLLWIHGCCCGVLISVLLFECDMVFFPLSFVVTAAVHTIYFFQSKYIPPFTVIRICLQEIILAEFQYSNHICK